MASAISPTDGRVPCDGRTARAPSEASVRARPSALATAMTVTGGATRGADVCSLAGSPVRAGAASDVGRDWRGRHVGAGVRRGGRPGRQGRGWPRRRDGRSAGRRRWPGPAVAVDVDPRQPRVARDHDRVARGSDGPPQLGDVDVPVQPRRACTPSRSRALVPACSPCEACPCACAQPESATGGPWAAAWRGRCWPGAEAAGSATIDASWSGVSSSRALTCRAPCRMR